MKPKVWIDNGHGANTAGKHSPDLRLREYKWCREVAGMVVDGLVADGIDAGLLVPETYDVSINNRCERVNRTCVERGARNVLLVSIHNNATPPNDGRWHDASYWSAWVYRQEVKDSNGKIMQVKEASRESKRLAELFTEAALEMRWKVGVGERPYKEANFGILRGSLCPAVLTENFFQDNRKDVDWLLTSEAKTTLALLHIHTIERYLYEQGI